MTHFIAKIDVAELTWVPYFTAMEARMTAAETLTEEVLVENDGKQPDTFHCVRLWHCTQPKLKYFCVESLTCKPVQHDSFFLFSVTLAQASELAVTLQKLNSLQQRLTASERHVEELQKQQEGCEMSLVYYLCDKRCACDYERSPRDFRTKSGGAGTSKYQHG